MADTRPFKINQPPSENFNARTEVASPPPGQAIIRSQQTGDPLPMPCDGETDHDAILEVGPAEADKRPYKNLK